MWFGYCLKAFLCIFVDQGVTDHFLFISEEHIVKQSKTSMLQNNIYQQSISQGWGAGKFFWPLRLLIFFQAAPAPDFFTTRLQLLVFFFERLRLQGAKNTRLRLLGKIFFSPLTSKVKLQKKYKTSKIIVFLTIKLLKLFYLKKSNGSTISVCFLSSRRAEEPAFFIYFYIFPGIFFSGSGSCLFFQAAPAPTPGFFSSGSGSPALLFIIYQDYF